MNFDRASAKAAGYSDQEIEEYLKTNPSPPTATNPISFGAGDGTPDYQAAGAAAETSTITGGGEKDKLISSWASDIFRDQQKTRGQMKSGIDTFYKLELEKIEQKEEEELKKLNEQKVINAAKSGIYKTPEDALTAGVPVETINKLKQKGVFNTEEPMTKSQANEVKDTIGNIDMVLNKDLSWVGLLGGIRSKIGGTEQFNTARKIQQIKDQLSLASVGKLKGQGQVSDAERRMLANASSALDVGMTEKAFREELKEVKKILERKSGVKKGKKDNGGLPDIPPTLESEIPQRKLGFDFSFGKKEDPYDKLKKGGELAKQALNEQNPVKKERLLAESRLLSEQGGDASRAEKINPLTYGGAKAQKFLSESETLPIISSVVGKVLAPLPGVGSSLGAIHGENLKGMLRRGGKDAFLPDIEQRNEQIERNTKTGLTYGITDLILSNVSKLFPKSVTKTTAIKNKIAEQTKKTFSGDVFADALEEYVKKNPFAKSAVKTLLPTLKGVKLTAKEVLDRLPVWNSAYGAGGQILDAPKKGAFDVLSKTAREMMRTQTPELSKAYIKWASSIAGKKALEKIFNPVSLAKGIIGSTIAGGTFAIGNKLLGIGKDSNN